MEASEKQPVPNLHVIPDVRHMPFEDRRAVFLDALRALTQMTGVAVDGGYVIPGVAGAYETRDVATLNRMGKEVASDRLALSWKAT